MCNVHGGVKEGRQAQGHWHSNITEWTRKNTVQRMDMCNVEGSKKGGRPGETDIATSQSGPGRTRYREWTCVTWRGQRREGGPEKLA